MVRAPCCEKIGLKKGPWTPKEDRILISFIQQNSHQNWRSLPKQAGLLRCGKSCRLRWMNYLRPDIKRGNFTEEEEETIIKLHEMLGNRWSAIAARLPRRTDNEIKNVWHTHLKKRLKKCQTYNQESKRESSVFDTNVSKQSQLPHCTNFPTKLEIFSGPQQCSSREMSSSVTNSSVMALKYSNNMVINNHDEMENFLEINESFWPGELSTDNYSNVQSEFQGAIDVLEYQTPFLEPIDEISSGTDDSMGFWYNLFIRAGDITELPEF